MWHLEQDPEPEFDIQNKDEEPPQSGHYRRTHQIQRTRRCLAPSWFLVGLLQITFDEKTSTIIYNKKYIVRKTIARNINPATRGSLKPQWHFMQDETITNYSPHTITLVTNNRKNKVIGNSDYAIVTQTIPTPPETNTINKTRIIHMVACKTVNEYHSNHRKL